MQTLIMCGDGGGGCAFLLAYTLSFCLLILCLYPLNNDLASLIIICIFIMYCVNVQHCASKLDVWPLNTLSKKVLGHL